MWGGGEGGNWDVVGICQVGQPFATAQETVTFSFVFSF